MSTHRAQVPDVAEKMIVVRTKRVTFIAIFLFGLLIQDYIIGTVYELSLIGESSTVRYLA